MVKMTARQERAYQRYLELRHQDAKSPYRVLEREQEVSYQTIKNWAEKFDWVDRADASLKRVSAGVEKIIEEKKIAGIQLYLEYIDTVVNKGLQEVKSSDKEVKTSDVKEFIELGRKIYADIANINNENNGETVDSISGKSKDTFADLSEQMARFNEEVIKDGGSN